MKPKDFIKTIQRKLAVGPSALRSQGKGVQFRNQRLTYKGGSIDKEIPPVVFDLWLGLAGFEYCHTSGWIFTRRYPKHIRSYSVDHQHTQRDLIGL